MPKFLRKIGGRWPLIIFAAALVYRAVYFLTVRGDPLMTYVDAVPDAWLYHHWALDLLAGTKAVGAYYIGPAYAYFLALVYKIFGVHLYAAIFVQFVLDAGTAVFVYGLARRLFDRTAAVIAGLVWVFYLPSLFFDTHILPPALTLFLVTASLFILTYTFGKGRRWAWAAVGSGAVFGVAILARPNLLLVPAFMVVWALAARPRPWRPVALFVLPVLVAAGAATVRNKIVADDWVFVSSQGGINFYIGNNENACGAFTPPPGMLARPENLNDNQSRAQAEAALGRPLKSSEASRYWFGRGVRFIVWRPWAAARLYATKFSLLTNSYETTLNTDYNFRRVYSFFHRVPIPYYGLILAFAVPGFALANGGPSPARAMLLAYVFAAAASVVLFFVVDWYRLPLAPALAVGAGGGAARLIADARARRWPSLAVGAAAVACLVAYSWLPGVGVDRDAVWTQSYHNYGTYYLVQGDYDRAIELYRKALEYKRDNAYALSYLGVAFEKKGRDDLARQYYAQALDVDPTDAETNYFLGANLARAGDYAGAVAPLSNATNLQPNNGDALLLLGECEAKMGNFAAAAYALGRAAAVMPNHAPAHARYAAALMTLGRYDEGVAEARRALALDPAFQGMHNLIGKYYFIRGDREAAVGEFRAETAVAPGAAEPHAFLAEYYYRRGDRAAGRAEYETYLNLGGGPITRFEREK